MVNTAIKNKIVRFAEKEYKLPVEKAGSKSWLATNENALKLIASIACSFAINDKAKPPAKIEINMGNLLDVKT